MTSQPMTEAEFLSRAKVGTFGGDDELMGEVLVEFLHSHGLHDMARCVPEIISRSSEMAWTAFQEITDDKEAKAWRRVKEALDLADSSTHAEAIILLKAAYAERYPAPKKAAT